MEIKKLGEITEIKSGFRQTRYLRELEYDGYETCKIIKFKPESREFDNIEEIQVKRKPKTSHYLNKNDLIMKLTPNFEAKTINFQEKDLTVPVNYAIIHNTNNLNTTILEYILNSQNIKKQLKKLANPTRINSINITTLQEVDVPSFKKDEEEIVEEIIKAYNEREKLMEEELNLYKKQINSILFKGE